MIKAVLPGDGGFLAAAASPDPYGAIHTACWALYGKQSGPPRFWRTAQEGLLSLSGDRLTVSGPLGDPQELAAFCAICGVQKLQGPRQSIERTAALLGWQIQVRQILSGQGRLRPYPPPAGLCQPSPWQVYPLLSEVFGLREADFAPWYCEVSHKLRHGLGRLLGVLADGTVVSTAGIYHQNGGAALISSVASSQPYRGRGYAAALVWALAQAAQNEGKIPFVVCRNPAALRVYRQIGFVPWGEEWVCLRNDSPV
ncbi:MAG: GNAT family N-acetyltransferase [Oscillospiraceae bacterium]|nr:GNAT family N-acetyltransferase [Oscillospiraceae bacterium]